MRIPRFLRGIWELWKKITHAIGTAISAIFLSVLWVLGIGSYALITKLHRLLKKNGSPTSYWLDVDQETADVRYQF